VAPEFSYEGVYQCDDVPPFPDWGAFMLKPLVPDVRADTARQLFGIGTDRFLISRLDVT
jgi:hypothetical protein